MFYIISTDTRCKLKVKYLNLPSALSNMERCHYTTVLQIISV